jgi:hypothetical protein
MRKKIIVRGPALSRSGYGEQTRFALRALRTAEKELDIYLIVVGWGQTGWMYEDDEERRWIDSLAEKTLLYQQQGGSYDVSLQITIPNEWERLAPLNIGYTAGIETTKIAPVWIEKANMMDKIILVSNHAGYAFKNTTYQARNEETGETIDDYKCTTPLEVVNYATRQTEVEEVVIDLKYDFNFLVIAQWGIRKNIKNTIKWFVEEFIDREIGLVLKTNKANNSTMDRFKCEAEIKRLLDEYPDRKCKVHLLHGDVTEGQLASLYSHPQIKALLSLSHGEGFGLPMFEAAQRGLPVITTDWSGQCDFLFMPVENKKTGKIKNKAMFAKVDYKLDNIQKKAVWDDVLISDSMWAFPIEGKVKMKMREVHKDYGRYLSQAKQLEKWITTNFTEEKQYKKFANATGLIKPLEEAEFVFVSDVFADEYTGGAELSLQTLIDTCKKSHVKIKTSEIDDRVLDFYKDKTWIFANVTQTSSEILNKIAESDITYHVSESDYKYCEHRLPQLCELFNGGKECSCGTKPHGKLYEKFYNNAKTVFFRSKKQKQNYMKALNLTKPKIEVLSALFPESFFEKIKELRNGQNGGRSNKWVIPDSPSWVKGSPDAEKWCEENNKEYIKLHGVSHDEVLKTLASSEGLCFLPKGFDTCPRLVIEAKLLDCKLHLNENVLHSSEKWFDTNNKATIEKHLRKQPAKFWNIVSAV